MPLNYHKSYDALIPVVKHIQYDNSFDIDNHKESEGWMAYYSMEHLVIADIEKLYNSVIKYIKWYNENIKNER